MQNIHIWKKVSKVQILSPSDIELSYFVTFWSSGGCRNGEMKKKERKKRKRFVNEKMDPTIDLF
jgi:hypothetical protein